MALVHFTEEEVIQDLLSISIPRLSDNRASMWGVGGISEFLLLNSKTRAHYTLTIIDKCLCSNPIVAKRLKQFDQFATLDHPFLYKIQIIHHTFTREEILILDGLKGDNLAILVFPPITDNPTVDTICLKVEQRHTFSVIAWVHNNHCRRDSPIFHQQQIVIIQNLIEVMTYLHSKNIFSDGLPYCGSFYCGESETTLNSPLVKIHLPSGLLGLREETVANVDDIVSLASAFTEVLTWGNPLVKNIEELSTLENVTSIDQILVEVIGQDNKFQQLMSFLRDPVGTGWLDKIQFTGYLGSGAFGLVLSAVHGQYEKVLPQFINSFYKLPEN